MQKVKLISMFKFLNMLKKRKTQLLTTSLKEENSIIKYKDFIIELKLNRRYVSLILCSLAFTIHSMYYYRISDPDIWFYFKREDFDKSYNDMRYLMLFLNSRAEKTYKNYKSFEIYIDKKNKV